MFVFIALLIVYNLICLFIILRMISEHVSPKRAEVFLTEQLEKLEGVTSIGPNFFRGLWEQMTKEFGLIALLLYIAALPAVLTSHLMVRYLLIRLNRQYQRGRKILTISENFIYYVYNEQLFIRHNDSEMLHTLIIPSEVAIVLEVNLILSYKELYALLKGTSYAAHCLALWRKYRGPERERLFFWYVQSDVLRGVESSESGKFLYGIWKERIKKEILSKG